MLHLVMPHHKESGALAISMSFLSSHDPSCLTENRDRRSLGAHTTSTAVLSLAALFTQFVDSMADEAER